MSIKRFYLTMSLVVILMLGTVSAGHAYTLSFEGYKYSFLTASMDASYSYSAIDGYGVLHLELTNTTYIPASWGLAEDEKARITGFAFNLPTGVTVTASNALQLTETGWDLLVNPDSVSTPEQFGLFDIALITGPNLNGGSPNVGIPVSETFIYEIRLTGAGAATLTPELVFSELSSPNNPNAEEQNALVRYQRVWTDTLSDKSDVAIDPPPTVVPEPSTMWLLLAGVGFVALVHTLRRRVLS